MMSMIAMTIASYSFGIKGLCYTTKTSLPKISNLALRLLVLAQQHTTDAGARLHFGCTATDEPLITLHAADWANNLGQSHQALKATLGAHSLITSLDSKSCTRLTRLCAYLKFRYQI